MKKTLLKTLYRSGVFEPFHWVKRDRVLILTYHRFCRGNEAGKVSADEFATHLRYLKSHCRVIHLDEAVSYLESGKSLPSNTTVITIDDGYADAYEIAYPLLKEFGLPAIIYVITDFLDQKIWLWTDLMRYVMLNTKKDSISIEFEPGDMVHSRLTNEMARLEAANRINERLKRLPNEKKEDKIVEIGNDLEVDIPALPPGHVGPLNWVQSREMDADNVGIGSQTVTLPILTWVGQSTLEYELGASKKRLEEVLDRPVEHFCYPNGTLDENVRTAARKAGYKSAVTTKYGFNDSRTNFHSMNRIDASPAIESFAQSVSGFEAARLKWFGQQL